MAELGKKVAAMAALPDDLAKKVDKDIDSVVDGFIKGLVKPDASFSYSVRTARGWETFAYDTTPTRSSSTKPLTLLNHLGGNPILAAVWRSGTAGDDYKVLAKWVSILADDAEKIALVKLPGSEQVLAKVRQDVFPLFRELGEITEQLWLPATADGQEGIVIDAKWTSRQWHAAMPSTDSAMPFPELSVVLGVSDGEKLGKALQGYRLTINKLIARAREFAPPDTIPEFEIPSPKIEEKDGRTYAFYPLPREWGLDPQVQPTGGIAGSVAAVALSRKHVERLLTPADLSGNLAPLQ